MRINGEKYTTKVVKYNGARAVVMVNGVEFRVEIDAEELPSAPKLVRSEKSAPGLPALSQKSGGSTSGVKAPIPGVIIDIMVKEGDSVNAGDVVCTLEAMKMESEIAAPYSGIVTKVNISKGASVQEGDDIIMLQNNEQPAPQPVAKPAPQQAAPVAQPQAAPVQAAGGDVTSPIPGTILDIKVKVGDTVNPDSVVAVLEAMKMESDINANAHGKVTEILVSKGESVQEGQALIRLGD